jgi:monoterpene epsilon-lactone hydrolase
MDPRVESLLPVVERFGFHSGDITAMRALFRETCATFPPPGGVTIEPVQLAGRDALRFTRDGGSDGRRILHLHGGAFVLAELDLQLMMPALLATSTGAEVVSLDYRVAPEHPCPAAIDDAVAAYEELAADGPVAAIAGESAGATLTVLAAVALRERGATLPDALLAISPWTDMAGTSPRHRDPDFVDPVVSGVFLSTAAAAWRGELPLDDPRVTPLHAPLEGLPPTLVHVGGAELLLEDSLALAQRLATAGVHVELRVFPDMPHVFTAYPNLTPECDQSLSAIEAFLNDWSGPPTVSATSPSPT